MDFLVGCGSSVAAETGNSLLAKVKKHIGYLFSYNNNVKTLDIARVNLDAKISDANRVATDSGSRFRTVSSSVAHWKKEADRLSQDAQKIISGHASNPRSLCPNPWARYSSSKEEWELTQEINEKVQNAPDFGTTFDLPAQNLGAKFNLTGVVEFESRLLVLNGVLEALKDEKVSMCSICGMGGMGKTTLAKKLVQRVEAGRLFAKVAMVTVSQDPSLQTIQNEIIELVGLKVDEQTMTARANRLNGWLADNRALLVLDDLWWKFTDEDFEAIGIPLASKCCKIVFTSRNEDECIKMGSRHNFRVDVLEKEEAWNLFREKADISTHDPNLHQTARDIASECGGLPIAIVTIAAALTGKPQGIWNDSLLKLRKSSTEQSNVYSRIQLSYDLINDEEAKACFLLCCLYPEDHDIPVEDLVLYGKGLQIFENVDTMSQARDRVESIVYKLKKSFMLLEGYGYEHVKMHDLMRDFAISVSSKLDHPYLVKCENALTQWPEMTEYENCSAISIACERMLRRPDRLNCPELKLLQLNFAYCRGPFTGNFFEGAKELQVLSMNKPALVDSLDALNKLRALRFNERQYGKRSFEPTEIGNLLHDNLRNLEILSIYTSRPSGNLLEKIGRLSTLRFLDLSRMEFDYIPPGAFSNLVKVEELYLSWKFLEWGCEETYRGRRMNASLNEIESLPLNALKLGITRGSVLAEDLVRRLTRFAVFIGSSYSHEHVSDQKSKQLVEMYDVEASDISASWISPLLRRCESLVLTKVRNLENIMFQRSAQLKEIYISMCPEMEYLADDCFSELIILWLDYLHNLKCCFTMIQEASRFGNLREVDISRCNKLIYVFPVQVARELRQLQRLTIDGCRQVEKIFQVDDQVVSGGDLEAETELQSTPKPTLNHEPKMTTCPSLCSTIFRREKQSKSVPNYHQVEENIPKEIGSKMDEVVFPQLKTLEMTCLPKLRIFYEGNEAIAMPSLHKLIISNCNNMEALSYGSFKASRLQTVTINDLEHPVEGDLNPVLQKTLGDYDGENMIRTCN